MQVIKDIEWQLRRLNSNVELEEVLQFFVVNEELGKEFNVEKARDKEIFLHQSLKILSIMEASETWKEFEKLAEKQRKNKKKKETTDFDKILKGLMKVPKPDKKKK